MSADMDADPGFRHARHGHAERFAARVEVDGRLVCVNPDVTHGKVATYSNWGCRCEPCVQANTAAVAAQRRRRYAERVPVDGRLVTTAANATHGISSTYRYYGCRCVACTAANTADQAYSSRRARGFR